LPKLWEAFNLLCGLSVEEEAVYQTPAAETQGQTPALRSIIANLLHSHEVRNRLFISSLFT
jgi:hypothetical protein